LSAIDQSSFIEFALAQGVLKFGAFELKSGRTSPYFFNAGRFRDGAALSRLGAYYAEKLIAEQIEMDVLFGPPYKGIPLVSATAIALARDYGQTMPYAYARKEVKDHGEGGSLVGADLSHRVVIVDDVITAGTAIRESIELITDAGGQVAGVIVAIDRQERGQQGTQSAIQEVQAQFNIPVYSLVCFDEIIAYVRDSGIDVDLAGMLAYRARYGAA
jgi:orotate phosphoribosyltransferase